MEKKIVFIGNPNVGKSTWINTLSNADFKVGNWPGVTVEKKEASMIWDNQLYHLIDLPGTYDLDHPINEELITSNYVKEEPIDLIVNIVDATNLARNLYVTCLLRELNIPMIIIFNYMDEVEKYKIKLDIEKLHQRLQVPIYPYSAFDKQGKANVIKAIQYYTQQTCIYDVLLPNDKRIKYDELFRYIIQCVPSYIEVDEATIRRMVLACFYQDKHTLSQLQAWDMDMQYIEQKSVDQSQKALHIYEVIQELMSYVQGSEERLKFTRTLDRVLLHPLFGIPLLLVICSVLMMFVFNSSAPFNEFIDFLIHDMLMKYMYVLFSFLPASSISLLLNGIIAGVGGVLVFVPLMCFLYIALSFLEECGYMARIAFLLDTFMHHFHLSGKSFVSLLLGFGCNVPAIYATRTLDNEKQKRLTALLIPFMSCGARLPVYMLFAAAFFKGKAAIMVISIYGIGILLALLVALLCSLTTHFQDREFVILELPPYRKPSFQVIRKKVRQEVRAYVHKAMGIVLWAMVILWGLSYFPNGNVQDSYVAKFSKQIAPIYEPLGFGTRWESVAALPGSIIAKETVVGFLGQVLLENETNIDEPITPLEDMKKIAFEAGVSLRSFVGSFRLHLSGTQDSELVSAISSLWSDDKANLRAYCYMIYILLSIPCVMSLHALYREYGYKLMCLSILMMLLVPYGVAFSIFQLFSLFL